MECLESSEIDGADVLRIAPGLLADEDTRLSAATSLVRRLQACMDDSATNRVILRLLCAHCSMESYLLDVFLELVFVCDEPALVINVMSVAASNASSDQIQNVIEAYKDLMLQDRSLLVPIIGSISELRLSREQKTSFMSLVEEALAVVHETDVPTVVLALLHITDSMNAKRVLAGIRHEASRIPLSTATLLVDPLVTAIRCRPECARLARTPTIRAS